MTTWEIVSVVVYEIVKFVLKACWWTFIIIIYIVVLILDNDGSDNSQSTGSSGKDKI